MNQAPAKQPEIADLPAKRSPHHVKWLALVALLFCLAAWAMRNAAPPPVQQIAPPPQTFRVVRGDMEQTISASGKLQLHKYADVLTRISGRIDDVLVGVGDEVKAGKLLLTVEPAQQQPHADGNKAQLARLHAELAEQKAQLEFAELQFKRQTQLKAENATREESFEASRTAWYAATARVEAINARIRQVELAIRDEQEVYRHTQITAPISGTIVAMSVRSGQVVSASQPSPLMRIADMSKLTVQARVAEVDVPRLKKGMAARFTTPGYPGRQWTGKIRQIIPVAAEGSGEQGKETFYNVLFDVNNPDRELMSGMSTKVDFVLGNAENTLLLPNAALDQPKENDGSVAVNVAGPGGRPVRRTIRIGSRSGNMIQILSGLSEGDTVLVARAPAAGASLAEAAK